MADVEEMETVLTYKKIAQNIKITADSLDRMEKSGIAVNAMNLNVHVPDTKYSVVYKVLNNPQKKLIAKKLLKC